MRRPLRRAALVAATALATLPVAGCGDDDGEALTVLAAASLSGTFTELAETFEEEHPDVEVRLVLGSSTMLAEQVADGAPGDVLATADEHSMRLAQRGDALADDPDPFAGNTLTLVTPPDNPAGITALADLDREGVSYVVCADPTPCGVIAADLLEAAGITHDPASEEVDVKAVLAKVLQGEADAGLVYRTDAVAAGDGVAEVGLDDAGAFRTDYLVAPIRGESARREDLAAEFIALVRGDRAEAVLTAAGFTRVEAR